MTFNKILPAFYSVLFLAAIDGAGRGVSSIALPENQSDAALEYAQGILDSETYAVVQPLYDQPLSVPQGELRYLTTLWPDVPSDFPIQPEILRQYEPWTEAQIQDFFKDYPYLIGLKPVLSFAVKRESVFATADFTLRMADRERLPYHSVKVLARPFRFLKAGGTMVFGDTIVRWFRRGVFYHHPRFGDVEIGNYNSGIGQGLFYGYFPVRFSPAPSAASRFLYGSSGTWNGAYCGLRPWRRVGFEAMFHMRQEETIAGVSLEARPFSNCKVQTGFSASRIGNDTGKADTTAAFHAGILFPVNKTIHIRCESGVTAMHGAKVPVHLSVERTLPGEREAFSWFYFPAGFYAPRSLILHASYMTFGKGFLSDSSVPYSLTGINLSLHRRMSEYISGISEISSIFSNKNAAYSVFLKLYGEKRSYASFSYEVRNRTKTDLMQQRFELSAKYPLFPFLKPGAEVAYMVRAAGSSFLETKAVLDVRRISAMRLAPYFMYITDFNSVHGASIGMQESFSLFEKTFAECSVKVPLNNDSDEGYFLYAKLCFAF